MTKPATGSLIAHCLAGLTLALGLQIAAGPAEAAGDGAAGRKLAIEKCALCHVIGDHNPYGGINSTPSFWIFARKPEVYTERLRTFDQRRPHIGIELTLKPEQIEDILSYVGGLEPK